MQPFKRLQGVMAALRDPKTGCPWDQQQTHQTLIPYLLEETYEVVDAIEQDDDQHLTEELGDLLLQIVFHAQIGQEEDRFNLGEIAEALSEKLIKRHPHVFANTQYASDAERDHAWETHKEKDREQKQQHGTLSGIPEALPALMQAEKLQKRAARVGFDWPDTEPVFDKLQEELGEVREAIAENHGKARVEEEIGDLLFVVANLARHLEINPEDALRKTNKKFIRRFNRVESGIKKKGGTLEASSLDEMEKEWQQAKLEENK